MKDELDSLNRLVVVFLESAELRVKEQKDLTMGFWKENVNALLQFQGKEVLADSGRISNKEMEEKVRMVYDNFNARRKEIDAQQADAEDSKIWEELSKEITNRQK